MTMTTDTKHNHNFNECWRIICPVTMNGGARHAHCGECDIAAFRVPIFPKNVHE